MVCKNCQAQMPGDRLFCTRCGTRLTPDVPAEPSAFGSVCPVCGAAGKDGMRFCIRCGAALSQSSAAFPQGGARSGKPVLTVNGENIPVELSLLVPGSPAYTAYFAGKTSDRAFIVRARFPISPGSGTSFSCGAGETAAINFSYLAQGANPSGGVVSTDPGAMTDARIAVAGFDPNARATLSVSGTAFCGGRAFSFYANGSAALVPNGEEIFLQWYEKNASLFLG